ncbi:chorismate-binding protein [Klebsiella pneumoniae]|nr:chorismate-binding protein [Klebsiella pneumoniae]
MSQACLLHPTPALSSFPHQAAKRLIAELEPFDRQLFGSIVGWCDDEGNGEWVVTIRCARVCGSVRAAPVCRRSGHCSGASSPLGEWRETDVKLTTILNVFGLN